jgi:hypothetical protein
MKKRGALELSVNAIVILIVAIAVLGLALGFIRKQFSKFDFPVGIADPDQPTSSNPITYTLQTQTVAAGKPLNMVVKVYNGGTQTNPAAPARLTLSANWINARPELVCSDLGISKHIGSYKDVNAGNTETWQYTAVIDSKAAGGTYICQLKMAGYNTFNGNIGVIANITASTGNTYTRVAPSVDIRLEVQ